MNKGYKLLGIGHSSGEFKGNNYDNFLLHCSYESEKINGVGTKVIKVKSSVFTSNPLKIGESFDVNYDQYQNVKDIFQVQK